jgi:hypothetical protein
MTSYLESTFENKASYIDLAKGQMEKWRDGLDKLQEETRKFPQEVQSAYRRDLGALRNRWQDLLRLFVEMENAGGRQWENARYQWGKAAGEFWQAFAETGGRIRDDIHVPLGWLQGLTDERIYQSAGWVEGMGERSAGSEGWVEGMGEQESASQGWTEGYERAGNV